MNTNCNNCAAPFNAAGICDHCGTTGFITMTLKKAKSLKEFIFSGDVSASQAAKAADIALHNADANLQNYITQERVEAIIRELDNRISKRAAKGRFIARYEDRIFANNHYMLSAIKRHYRGLGFRVWTVSKGIEVTWQPHHKKESLFFLGLHVLGWCVFVSAYSYDSLMTGFFLMAIGATLIALGAVALLSSERIIN